MNVLPPQTTVSVCSYVGSFTCIALSFLNEYAAAIGVTLALLTYVTNLVFNILKWRREKKGD